MTEIRPGVRRRSPPHVITVGYKLLDNQYVARRHIQDVRDVTVWSLVHFRLLGRGRAEWRVCSKRMAPLCVVVFIPFFFSSLCSSKQQASPLSSLLVVVPQVCACSDAVSRAHPRVFPRSGSLATASRLRARPVADSRQHLWFVPARQRIKLPPRPLTAASRLHAQPRLRWRSAPAPCLTIRHGLQCLGFCSSGFLSPANKLDVGGPLGQGWCSARRRWRFPLHL